MTKDEFKQYLDYSHKYRNDLASQILECKRVMRKAGFDNVNGMIRQCFSQQLHKARNMKVRNWPEAAVRMIQSAEQTPWSYWNSLPCGLQDHYGHLEDERLELAHAALAYFGRPLP